MNHTLIINRNDSKCGNCGLSAWPEEKTHEWSTGGRQGCGVRWVMVTSHYGGPGIKEAILNKRPDLEWTDCE